MQLPPLIIAHRGAKWKAPENTKSAFDTALAYPIQGIEFDVQLTKDEIPVIYHDRSLYKINRSRRRISDYTFKELENEDWGGWFSKQFHNEPLLSLENALQLYCHRTQLLVEIKSREHDNKNAKIKILTRKVIDLISNNISDDLIKKY